MVICCSKIFREIKRISNTSSNWEYDWDRTWCTLYFVFIESWNIHLPRLYYLYIWISKYSVVCSPINNLPYWFSHTQVLPRYLIINMVLLMKLFQFACAFTQPIHPGESRDQTPFPCLLICFFTIACPYCDFTSFKLRIRSVHTVVSNTLLKAAR